jgi:intein/homing endonuclease
MKLPNGIYVGDLFMIQQKFNLSNITFSHYDLKRNIKLPKKPSVELAEFIGIVLGDGNVNSTKSGSHQIRITADSRLDYLQNHVTKLCVKLFNIIPKFYKFKNRNVLHLIITGKALIEYFLLMGIKSGSKIRNQSTIPKWIWKSDEYLKACLRGLIDTDGSIYELLPNWPGLFQLTFENRNITLLRDTRKIFVELGFNPSKICGNKTNYGTKFYITRKSQIQKYLKEIGFSNIKHIQRTIKLQSPLV